MNIMQGEAAADFADILYFQAESMRQAEMQSRQDHMTLRQSVPVRASSSTIQNYYTPVTARRKKDMVSTAFDQRLTNMLGKDAIDISGIMYNSAKAVSKRRGVQHLGAQGESERLANLAARENTFIDNPYQSSHI